MAAAPRTRKRVRAIPRASDGSAFQNWEEFKENNESKGSIDSIEIDRKGFETWKNMSKEERQPYVREACYVDFVHGKALRKEACIMSKGDAFYESSKHSDDSDGWHTYKSEDEKDQAAAESSEPVCFLCTT
ncbi:hypothetical protein G4B88_011696 [Cannabis sativa]|uniref:Uncharacterized protein n=1 Tax=Cannabis sativa TaxID=3483 RepID=A0A7J6FS88_CANSA|nr:hypothetical protein G4B88_011696 [Cannabis sativa]